MICSTLLITKEKHRKQTGYFANQIDKEMNMLVILRLLSLKTKEGHLSRKMWYFLQEFKCLNSVTYKYNYRNN